MARKKKKDIDAHLDEVEADLQRLCENLDLRAKLETDYVSAWGVKIDQWGGFLGSRSHRVHLLARWLVDHSQAMSHCHMVLTLRDESRGTGKTWQDGDLKALASEHHRFELHQKIDSIHTEKIAEGVRFGDGVHVVRPLKAWAPSGEFKCLEDIPLDPDVHVSWNDDIPHEHNKEPEIEIRTPTPEPTDLVKHFIELIRSGALSKKACLALLALQKDPDEPRLDPIVLDYLSQLINHYPRLNQEDEASYWREKILSGLGVPERLLREHQGTDNKAFLELVDYLQNLMGDPDGTP